MFTPLLQTVQTIWNWALGLDIIGTFLFLLIAYYDWYSPLVVFITIVCIISNILWAKMFTDLHRNDMTINFFLFLAGISFLATIFACRAKRRPSDFQEDLSDEEYEYVYESEDADDVDEKKKDK